MENKNVKVFSRIIKSNEKRLLDGDVLSILLHDGYLTVFNEIDNEGKNKTVTLIDKFDYQLDLSTDELININSK